MSLKARLRIAIVALVTFVVVAMSVLYLYDFTRISFRNASERASVIADQVKGNLVDILNRQTAARGIHPAALEDWKANWTQVIRTDPEVEEMLKRSLASSSANMVLAVLVTDQNGDVLASSNPSQNNSRAPASTDFNDLQKGNWVTNLWDLMNRREDYSATRSIGPQSQQQVLFKIVVVVQSVLLKNEVAPALKILGLAFGASLFIAIFLGSVLPGFLLDPLQRVSRNIDLISAGEYDTAARPQREAREFAAVQSKLTMLGEQFRGAKQDAIELRSNVEQLMQRLEEAVLLFDNSGRLLLAGEGAERMLGKAREQMLGHKLEELFPSSTVLGGVIAEAVRQKQAVLDQPVAVSRPDAGEIRLLVSVDVLRKSPGQPEMGTLVKLRDVESRRQLERQLDLSSRVAALSRLTGGVAHEIKNPLNAMALHLEVLRGKLEGPQPELDVISREIKRLDNVVKTFLNFNKPVEVRAVAINLSRIVDQVVALVSVDAQAKNIHIERPHQEPLWINGDPELLKQAILNIVNNGMEAMQDGGTLTICTDWAGEEGQVTITDSGMGIAPEVRDRIFHLYFTTKENGSGIGLATTFRVVQLHSGTIDFVSEPGKGTTFRLRFPRMIDHGEALTSASSGS